MFIQVFRYEGTSDQNQVCSYRYLGAREQVIRTKYVHTPSGIYYREGYTLWGGVHAPPILHNYFLYTKYTCTESQKDSTSYEVGVASLGTRAAGYFICNCGQFVCVGGWWTVV